MGEFVQLAIIFAIVSLTIVFVFLGVQFYKILGEGKKSVEKVNKMLDDMGIVTGSIAKPLSDASGFFNGLSKGMKFVGSFFGREKSDKKKEEG